LKQADVKLEVIIVDDSSTDGSLHTASTFAATNKNVRVISNPSNVGAVESFNIGAREAAGEFLVRLDADDLLTPGSLSRATLLAQTFKSVGLVYGHPLHFKGELPRVTRAKTKGWTIWPGRTWLELACNSGKNVITSPEVLMRTAVVREIGYQAPLRHAHDMELWLRLSAFADVGYVRGADQALHREHDESMSAREVDGVTDLGERLKAFETLFLNSEHEIPGSVELLQIAKDTLVAEVLQVARLEVDRGQHDQGLFRSYLSFAKEVCPEITNSPEWQHLAGNNSPRSGLLRQLSSIRRRATGRLRQELHWHCWRRNGVYVR